jgi:hypothetical protein
MAQTEFPTSLSLNGVTFTQADATSLREVFSGSLTVTLTLSKIRRTRIIQRALNASAILSRVSDKPGMGILDLSPAGRSLITRL